MDPENEILFYSKLEKEFIYVVIYPYGFMGDQPGKRHYTNHAARNSNYRGMYSISCNIKDIFHELPSCQICVQLLSNEKDINQCSNCLNQNPLNAYYSNEYVKENGGSTYQPFKLVMKLQERKGKEIHNDIV